MPKQDPTSNAAIILGSLMLKTVNSSNGDQLDWIGRTLDSKMLKTVVGSIGYLPKKREPNNASTGARIKIILSFFFTSHTL